MKFRMVPVLAVFMAVPASAQQHEMQHAEHTGDHMVAAVRSVYEGVRNNLIAAAEQMPESEFAFAPAEGVRNFGQLIGHVANSAFSYCSVALGVENPNSANFEEITSKAGLVEAVKSGFAHCDKAYQINDMQAMEMTEGRMPRMKLWYLVQNTSHSNEHYGNIVTYMRAKGHTPPSSMRGM